MSKHKDEQIKILTDLVEDLKTDGQRLQHIFSMTPETFSILKKISKGNIHEFYRFIDSGIKIKNPEN